ncbi:MAG: ribosome assembly RNA-binding protein YhbY [Deltaproteobacteria bacterium]|nr:ribosome assembly RNA-binding protein YhbY [Deltaproteobacteria bacterium]
MENVPVEGLKSHQKKYLKAMAHGLKPLVFVGRKGLSPALTGALNEALDVHELIKVKFLEFKEKEVKKQMADAISKETAATLVGIVGHIAIFFRPQADPERRKISLPL